MQKKHCLSDFWRIDVPNTCVHSMNHRIYLICFITDKWLVHGGITQVDKSESIVPQV